MFAGAVIVICLYFLLGGYIPKDNDEELEDFNHLEFWEQEPEDGYNSSDDDLMNDGEGPYKFS